MATFQTCRKSHMKTRASVRKNFSEGVSRLVKSLLQSEKELCSVSEENCWKQDEHARVMEVTFLGFNEGTDTARVRDVAAVSLELQNLLSSLHFCSLNENEIICMEDIKKPPDTNSGPLNQRPRSGMLCVMRVSPTTVPRLRLDFIFSLLSKYATGLRYTLETYLHQRGPLESTPEDDDDDDTNQSVSSIEDDFVTAFEHVEEDETLQLCDDGLNLSAIRSQCDVASQTVFGRQFEMPGVWSLASSGQQTPLTKPFASLINIQGPEEPPPSAKASVTTSVSETWTQRSFYRSTQASDKGSETQKHFLSSSPAYSSESECSSPSPVIFLDEEGYQKSLQAKLQLPKLPVTKDDVEDSDSEVSEFFDSFDQFDELEQTLDAPGLFVKAPTKGKPSKKKEHKPEKSVTITMNPQKFKFDRPALPANVRKPTPRKPDSPYSNPCEAPDSPRPVPASGDDGSLFSPIRSSAFSPLGGCAPPDCICQTQAGRDRAHEHHEPTCCTYEDYAESVSSKVLDSILHPQQRRLLANTDSIQSAGSETEALKQHDASRNKSLVIKESIQKFAADLVEKSFGGAFKDLQKGVTSCTNALCHLAIKLTSSVFQMAFDELRRQCEFSLKERAIGCLANFLVTAAFSNALKDLQFIRKRVFTDTVARFAADLAEELVLEGVMEVCQFSRPLTPAFLQHKPSHSEDKVVKSYAKDLSESVVQEALIELSQVDMTTSTKAATNVFTGNTKCVSVEITAPSIQPAAVSSTCSSQAIVVSKPVQEYRKEYTVQQALFCTSGIVTAIPMPLTGSALLPYRIPANSSPAKSLLSADESHSGGDSASTCVTVGSKDGEVAYLQRICLPSDSEHHPRNQKEFKSTHDDTEAQNASEVANDPAIISNFSAVMVHTIVTETLESVASLRVPNTVVASTDYLPKTAEGKSLPVHSDPTAGQQGGASLKDVFADRLSQSVIKHCVDESRSAVINTDEDMVSKQDCLVLPEEPRLTLGPFLRFLDPQDQCVPSAGKACAPECQGPHARGISPETAAAPCPTVAVPQLDSKELAREKPGQQPRSRDAALVVPLCFGQEGPYPPSHTLTPPVLACVDGLHVEDKQKIRDGNGMPGTPPSTPLVPSRARSEWDIKKLTKKLKGELAKEFAPATPPSTPYNPSVGSLAASEQNTIEKEEFMLKLMRSLSEEVESSEGEEHTEVDAKAEHSGKRIRFADELATHIISLATEMAASHLHQNVIEEPKVKSPDLDLQSQASLAPAFLNRSDENMQALWNYAGDVATEVITEAEKTAKRTSCVFPRHRKNSCCADGFCLQRGGQLDGSEDKLEMEAVVQPREADPLILSLPLGAGVSGLTYKYPSCESVTDEYAGHVIQILKQEGGNGELILDQYANRLAYRSVKAGLREAVKTTHTKSTSKMFPGPGSREETVSELLMYFDKDQPQEVAGRRQSKRKGGHSCKNPSCERTQEASRNEYSKLCCFSASLAHSITRDVQKALTMPAVGLPKSLTDSCLCEKCGCVEGPKSSIEPALFKPLEPSSQNHLFNHSLGSLNGHGCGENVVHAIELYAQKVVEDSLELSFESAVIQGAETTKSAGRITYAEKLSPLISQACRYCNLKELHDCTGNSTQHFFRQDTVASSKPASDLKLNSIYQKSRIFHLDVPQIHINLDKTVLAEKIVAEAIEKAERELSNTSLAADSGIGQDGVSYAESLITEVMTSVMMNVGHASSSKEKDDFQLTESFGTQQLGLSIGEDSSGSWSNLSFEDEPQDESSSFHHLSERDEPVDRDEEPGADLEGLGPAGKALLVSNVDTELCTVDPQLRLILQWLVASEAEVEELYFHDSAKKEFLLLAKRLQERGWKVGDLLQAVLKYYEVMEQKAPEEPWKSLFDFLLEKA